MMAGAAAAAAGSVASQVVGMAIGAQEGFNWKGVATAALGGAVTAGVGSFATGSEAGSWGSLLKGSEWTNVAARAAVSNVVTQGVGNITGLQRGFSWTSVAASYVGAAVGNQLTARLESSEMFSGLQAGMTKFAIDTTSGFASGLSASVVRGGKISVAQIATDAFGNALGSSLAGSINGDGRTFSRRPSSDFTSITAVDSSGPTVDIGGLLAVLPEVQNPETEPETFFASQAERDEWWRAGQQAIVDNERRFGSSRAFSNGVDANITRSLRDISLPRPLMESPVTGRFGSFMDLSREANQVSAAILQRESDLNAAAGQQLRPWDGVDRKPAAIEYLKKEGYLDIRADQMQFQVAKQLPAALVIASTPPLSLGSFLAGAGIGGGASATAQHITKGEIDGIDTLSSALTGGLTYGKSFIPSVAVNSAGAYLTADYKGEDPRWKVASAVVGTGAGGLFGGFIEKQMANRAIVAAMGDNARYANYYLAGRAPVGGLGSSGVAESVNWAFDKLPPLPPIPKKK